MHTFSGAISINLHAPRYISGLGLKAFNKSAAKTTFQLSFACWARSSSNRVEPFERVPNKIPSPPKALNPSIPSADPGQPIHKRVIIDSVESQSSNRASRRSKKRNLPSNLCQKAVTSFRSTSFHTASSFHSSNNSNSSKS